MFLPNTHFGCVSCHEFAPQNSDFHSNGSWLGSHAENLNKNWLTGASAYKTVLNSQIEATVFSEGHVACALRALGPVLEISFGPPSADFGGLFGPPKKRVNFDMFKKHQKCVFSILTPNHLTRIHYCCPTVFYSINKAASLSSGIYFGPLSFFCY